MTWRVVAVEGSALIQDRGRPGLADSGVSPSGAFDRAALNRVNRILGNPRDTAAIELIGRMALRAEDAHLVAVTGAVGPLFVGRDPVHHEWPVTVPAGVTLLVGPATAGLRSYLGVAGGFAVPEVLGSRSRDTLSGLGPEPLVAGDELPVGPHRGETVAGEPESRLSAGDLTVGLRLGPRDDWFAPEAIGHLFSAAWTMEPLSDRVGLRLEGPELIRLRSGELPSEPCRRGSVQVTSDGRPVILGPDHPVTGGYPVIGVVADAHTDLLAQARPGQTIRFRRAT